MFRTGVSEDGEEEQEAQSKEDRTQSVIKNWILFIKWLSGDDILKYEAIYKLKLIAVLNWATILKEEKNKIYTL